MRRFFILAIVALLGALPFATASRSVLAQQPPASLAWEGIGAPAASASKAALEQFLGAGLGESADDNSLVARLAAYEVPFNQELAHVPEIPDNGAEFMIVVVQTAEFALLVYDETLVVDPATPRQVEILNGLEYPQAPEQIYFERSGTYLKDENDGNCESMCTILPGTAVLLLAGDRIIAPAGHECYYCLLNGDSGSLLVYPLLRAGHDFSWTEHRLAALASASGDSGARQLDDGATEAPSGMMAWAFFNPGPGCHRGPGP